MVAKTIDNLFRQGANVIYSRIATVHVHGHASQEELKTMLSIVNPRYFVPIHGERRHLVAHAALARSMGIPDEHTFVLEDGDVLALTPEEGVVIDNVPAGHVCSLTAGLSGMETAVSSRSADASQEKA